jgi:hypothetical protein
MGRKTKYTDDDIRQAIQSSPSYAQALKKLGLKPAGGNYQSIKQKVNKIGIDTSHMTGCGHLKGKKHGWSKKIPLEYILVEDSCYKSIHLKKRLFKAGVFENRCYECGTTEWRGHPIPTELEHINGNSRDHRIENLTILCLHCHALTPTWRRKKKV